MKSILKMSSLKLSNDFINYLLLTNFFQLVIKLSQYYTTFCYLCKVFLHKWQNRHTISWDYMSIYIIYCYFTFNTSDTISQISSVSLSFSQYAAPAKLYVLTNSSLYLKDFASSIQILYVFPPFSYSA